MNAHCQHGCRRDNSVNCVTTTGVAPHDVFIDFQLMIARSEARCAMLLTRDSGDVDV